MRKKAFPRTSVRAMSPVTSVEIPPVFFYPIVQGGKGEPELRVRVRQKVKSGDILASPRNEAKANGIQRIHTAVGGVVKNIRTFRYSGNYTSTKAVEIDFGGGFNTFSKRNERDIASLDATSVFEDIAKAGIFDIDIGPLDEALRSMLRQNVGTLILNAVELPPYMTLEEKILEVHSYEIAMALAVLQQAIRTSGNSEIPNILLVSRYAKNRKNILQHVQKIMGKSRENKAKKISLSVELEGPPVTTPTWVLRQLFDERRLEMFREEKKHLIVLRPSTLLAIYEAVFCEKPFVEKYVQVVTSDKKTSVVKALMGMPLFYLLTQIPEISKEANHFFVGDFMKRSIVFDFTTPISKHFSHIFALTDESFAIMYSRLRLWNSAAQRE